MKLCFIITSVLLLSAQIGGLVGASDISHVKNPVQEHGASSIEKAIYIGGPTSPKPPCPLIPAQESEAFWLFHVTQRDRPAQWAQPISINGVPNLHKVSDALYRSAQPTASGMTNLKKMGIRTIVNLRSFHSDRDEIGKTDLGYEHIYMKTWHPEEKEVVRFLQIVTDPIRSPVLVHCQHGADRTGAMIAIYRIAVEGWAKEEAVKEMTEGDYGFHGVWKNLIKWIESLDIAAIKRKAGL